MSDSGVFYIGFLCGLLLASGICLSVMSGDWRSKEIISEYKSGKIICSDLDGELICRRKQ